MGSLYTVCISVKGKELDSGNLNQFGNLPGVVKGRSGTNNCLESSMYKWRVTTSK